MERKILVVDDDRNIVRVLQTRLEANQYRVVTAFDGDEGLEKVASEKPDLVILDVMMPKMDGYTFVLKLRGGADATAKIPVIILTAKDRMRDLFEMEGIDDYVVKPFTSEDLLGKINKVLTDRHG
jgi:DNA-binding response OmpR family regulator